MDPARALALGVNSDGSARAMQFTAKGLETRRNASRAFEAAIFHYRTWQDVRRRARKRVILESVLQLESLAITYVSRDTHPLFERPRSEMTTEVGPNEMSF